MKFLEQMVEELKADGHTVSAIQDALSMLEADTVNHSGSKERLKKSKLMPQNKRIAS